MLTIFSSRIINCKQKANFHSYTHEKNGFSKFSLDTDLKIILLNYQNNYVGYSN